ncbi:MAG: UDP-N-acetylmuramate dehydrogenase [Oscillospiraceae bacterium]
MERLNALKTKLAQISPTLELLEQEPMSRHTTFRVGGPVSLMALPRSVQQAADAVRAAAEEGITPFFLGNGSNLLVPDAGVDAFVIKTVNGLSDVRVDGTCITAESGILLSRLAVFARDCGLSGLEFAHGIPGSLGGAVTMNAGAYDGEMAQVVSEVTYLNTAGQVETTNRFDFSYRHSAFSDGTRMILGGKMQLRKGDPDEIRSRMEELMERRKSKQPLEWPSAGSTFKRPQGHFAAALIDQCGLKGLTVGGAQVSEKHAGFVINRGGATCADILELMEQVRRSVFDQTGVTLEPEVKLLGR